MYRYCYLPGRDNLYNDTLSRCGRPRSKSAKHLERKKTAERKPRSGHKAFKTILPSWFRFLGSSTRAFTAHWCRTIEKSLSKRKFTNSKMLFSPWRSICIPISFRLRPPVLVIPHEFQSRFCHAACFASRKQKRSLSPSGRRKKSGPKDNTSTCFGFNKGGCVWRYCKRRHEAVIYVIEPLSPTNCLPPPKTSAHRGFLLLSPTAWLL